MADVDASFEFEQSAKDSLSLQADSHRRRCLKVTLFRLNQKLQLPSKESILKKVSPEVLDESFVEFGGLVERLGEIFVQIHLGIFGQFHGPKRGMVSPEK